jgi:hypothetical protein
VADLDSMMADYDVDALVVTDSTDILYQQGNLHQSTNLASVRKSIISMLYGIAVDK